MLINYYYSRVGDMFSPKCTKKLVKMNELRGYKQLKLTFHTQNAQSIQI